MSKKLTREQVIRALKRLEKGWPDDLWIFVGDGVLNLMEKDEHGDQVETPSGCCDPEYSIEAFYRIEADGGGW